MTGGCGLVRRSSAKGWAFSTVKPARKAFRTVAFAAFLATGMLGGDAYAQALRPLWEGALGMPLSPGRQMWEPRRPTTLLGRDRFVITMSGQAADLLGRKYAGGADRGYSIGLNGSTVATWDYGTTGIWALGSGQTQEWSDPDGVYSLSPSPKIGLMAISHAKRTESGWELAASILRSSFSLGDTFTFDRFPSSGDLLKRRYLYDLLPEAIGSDVGYDALGDKLDLVVDMARDTPFGKLGVAGTYWNAGMDWMTRHHNTISSPVYNRRYLADRLYVVGDGEGDWDGFSGEARWQHVVSGAPTEVRAGRSTWSGHTGLWLSNPARFPSGDGGTQTIEPPTWFYNTLDVDSWNVAAETEWHYTQALLFRGTGEWVRYDFASAVFARTPVLNIDRVNGQTRPIDHEVTFDLQGETDVVALNAVAVWTPMNSPWTWNLGLGLVQVDGGADVIYQPHTTGFNTSGSTARWEWNSLRLAYAQLSGSRRLTSQISVGYLYRQYLPVSGGWSRAGEPVGVPAEIHGVGLGSMFQVSASMSL